MFSPWDAETNPAGYTVGLQGKPKCMAIMSWFHCGEKQTLNLCGSKYKIYTFKIFTRSHSQ